MNDAYISAPLAPWSDQSKACGVIRRRYTGGRVRCPAMDPQLSHFAINADDVAATRAFYEGAFGWSFTAYAPGFLRCELPDGTACAIQERRRLGDHPVYGFECTFAVDDVGTFVAAVEAAGGRIVLGPSTIPGVGELVFAQDPGGNVVGAMRYDRE
jgi:predicted enzyme related to lactoylglutathione lyase